MKLKEEYIKLSESQRLYELKVPVIGLTGGIATGKSSVTGILRDKGYEVICADVLIKKIYELEETLTFIEEVAPHTVSGSKINFQELRKAFFSNEKLKEDIENFLYKELKTYFLLEANEIIKSQDLIIYDVPLLFEKKLESLFDLVVVVYSPRDLQFTRVKDRDRNSDDIINNILNAQYDIETKKDRADYVVNNTADLSSLESEVDHLIASLFESEA